MNRKELMDERERLQRKLDWLGVRSNSYERMEDRIKEINTKLGHSHERYLERVGGSHRRFGRLIGQILE